MPHHDMTYLPLTKLAQEQISRQLQPGQIAIDATVGNGHDTVFLAERVGDTGQVFGFDIQQQALAHTRQRLLDAKLQDNVILIHDGHQDMRGSIPLTFHGGITAIMFNLGYLPGSNKSSITQPDTTVTAIKAASELLTKDGVITILVYRGHAGGMDESDAVARILDSLSRDGFEISKHTSPGPWLYIIKKITGAGAE
jgi:cyclopropane fatty-acyl-phospholipid synthase-like methyltransferase